MNLHANSRTCPHSRVLLCRRVVEQQWKLQEAAEAAGCSARTAAKWVARYRDGDRELLDRSSRPHRSPSRLPWQRVQAIEALRRVRMTAAEIAEVLELPLSTVSLWLKRIGLGKRSRLEPLEPPNRYERRHPGELVHVDIKKLARISVRGAGHRVLGVGQRQSQHSRRVDGRKTSSTGYEYLHVMIDDHSRVAYAELLDDLTAACAIAFLRRGVAWFAERGVARPGGDERQRLLLHRPPIRRRARPARPQTPPDQALPPEDKRQSRAADPDTPTRMGLRPPLRQLTRTSRRPRPLPRPLQLPTTTRQPQPPATGLETEQPR